MAASSDGRSADSPARRARLPGCAGAFFKHIIIVVHLLLYCFCVVLVDFCLDAAGARRGVASETCRAVSDK